MEKSDFQIGHEFFTITGRWMCTDVGTRVISAIKKDMEDASWHIGPPYAAAEVVFDEVDLDGCMGTYDEAVGEWGDEFIKAEVERRKPVTLSTE